MYVCNCRVWKSSKEGLIRTYLYGRSISVGDTVGGAATLVNTFAIGTTAGRKYPTTQSGGALAWEDTGTADIRLTVTNSAATSAGEVRVTILYAQNNNLG